jgi:toxin ParE1/3/4
LAGEASEEIATRFVGAVEATFEPLRHFPLSGPAHERLAPGLRVTFRQPYIVYYVVAPDAIAIVRILLGARDTTALAGRGGFA